MKPELLVLIALRGDAHREIAASFDVRYAPTSDERERAIAEHGGTIRAVLTNGSTLTAAEIDRLPQLTFVSALGAGYEHIDVAHAKTRGVTVVTAPAPTTIAWPIMRSRCCSRPCATSCSSMRKPARACGATAWRCRRTCRARSSASSAGKIGEVRARPASTSRSVITTGRRRTSHRYFDRVDTLAQWADFLIVATPGGAGTRHLIDRAVLDALGPRVRRQRVTRQRCRYRCFGGRVA